MSRIAKKIKCNENDILELQAIVQNPLSDPHLAMRATAILLCIKGGENKDIANELGVRNNTVGDWRRKYIENGINGLIDKERPGRRGKNGPDKRKLVKELMAGEPEDGSEWTAKSLSTAADTSVDTVRRALREEGIILERRTRRDVSVENMPAPASIGIAGIYLSDAGKAVVIATSRCREVDMTKGHILTRTAASASDLEKHLSEEGYVPIADALELLSQDEVPSKGTSRRHMGMKEYLNNMGNALYGKEGIALHAVVLPCTEVAAPVLSCRNMSVTVAPDFESWVTLIGLWIDPLYGNGSARIKDVLFRYTDERMAFREPVIWKTDAEEWGNKGNQMDEPSAAIDGDLFSDSSVKNVLRISATIVGRNGSKICMETEIPNGVPGLEEISYGSARALGASVGKVERAVSAGMTDVAKKLCEGYVEAALKKQCRQRKSKAGGDISGQS